MIIHGKNELDFELNRLRWVATSLRRLGHDMEAAALEFRVHIIEQTVIELRAQPDSEDENDATA